LKKFSQLSHLHLVANAFFSVALLEQCNQFFLIGGVFQECKKAIILKTTCSLHQSNAAWIGFTYINEPDGSAGDMRPDWK